MNTPMDSYLTIKRTLKHHLFLLCSRETGFLAVSQTREVPAFPLVLPNLIAPDILMADASLPSGLFPNVTPSESMSVVTLPEIAPHVQCPPITFTRLIFPNTSNS